MFGAGDLLTYAGHIYDYFAEHPAAQRLTAWYRGDGLALGGGVGAGHPPGEAVARTGIGRSQPIHSIFVCCLRLRS